MRTCKWSPSTRLAVCEPARVVCNATVFDCRELRWGKMVGRLISSLLVDTSFGSLLVLDAVTSLPVHEHVLSCGRPGVVCGTVPLRWSSNEEDGQRARQVGTQGEGRRKRPRCISLCLGCVLWWQVWTTTFSGSRRVGEAQNPGPSGENQSKKVTRWLQANITGACNLDCVLSAGADFLLLTEPRCTHKALQLECRKWGLACTGAGVEGELLAAVVYDPALGCEFPPGLEGLPHWRARVAGARVQLTSKQAGIVWTVYGFDRPSATELAELQVVLRGLVVQARALGDVPILCGGDFNALLGECGFAQTLCRGGWWDCGDCPTCFAAQSVQGRRLDWTLVNPAFGRFVREYQTHWELGLPTHAVQQWHTEKTQQPAVWTYALGKGLGEEPHFEDEVFLRAWQHCRAGFQVVLREGLLDAAWEVLEGCLVSAYGPGAKSPKARVVLQDAHPRTLFGGDAETVRLRAVGLRKRRLQQMRIMVGQVGREREFAALKSKLAGDSDPAWATWGMMVLNEVTLDCLVQAAREEEDRARSESREARSNSCHRWANDETKGAQKQVYRWIREGARLPQGGGLCVAPDGSLVAGEAGLIMAVDREWWPLWKPEQDGRTRPPSFGVLGQGALPPLSVEVLRSACLSTGLDKAPGEDGWTAWHMKGWSQAAWEAVKDLLMVVEERGAWPRQLQKGLVCLLPKGGVGPSIADPLQARPVVLLAVLYRVWAKARAPWLEKWIRAAGVQPVEENGAACEDLAIDLAFAFEEAKALGQTAWAVATDLSKAYDRIPLQVLKDGLRDMGLPEGLWRPLCAMAEAPRQIKVQSVVGLVQVPTHGLVPGCPLATYTMGLVLHRWRSQIWQAVPHAMRRCWVDDSTAAAAGDRVLGLKLVLANTVAFEGLAATDAMKVNQGKSGFLTTNDADGTFVAGVLEERQQWWQGGVVVLGEPGDQEPMWVREAPNQARGALEDDRDVLVAAAKASVIVLGPGAWFPAVGLELAAITGCVVLRGLWSDLTDEESRRARAQLMRHAAEGRWCMTFKKTLKDLGVAQGLGKEAKDLAARRHEVLQERTLAVARLAVQARRAERLVATSGVTAGLYGVAAHPPDSDTISCMRRWVLHACYKGSRFAQAALWFTFCATTWKCDPAKVWGVKAAEAVARQVAQKGLEAVRCVWEAETRDGPVAGLKAVLRQFGVVAGCEEWAAQGRVLRQPLQAAPADRKSFILEAVERADLLKAATRKGQGDISRVDVGEARRLLRCLPKAGLQEALRSVFAGDCVVRAMTRHWQGHDGKCGCGLVLETRGHIFWECPGTVSKRLLQEAGHSHQISPPTGIERELGLPFKDPLVEGWRADWLPPPREVQVPWTAKNLYVDASALFPKLPSIRTVGWAVVDGKNHARGGVLPPGSSVAWGETFALLEAYVHCDRGATIWSDCQAATKLWWRCHSSAVKRYAGALQALVPDLRRAREARPDVRVVWVPSHRELSELQAEGYSAETWAGNNHADREAKKWAAVCVAPAAVVARVQQGRARAGEIARVVAEVQLSRLQQRLRTGSGAAVKARKRQAPGGLRRTKVPSAKRICIRKAAPPAVDLKDFLMPAKRAAIPAEVAKRLVEEAVVAEGFHDLRPRGPWPAAGSCEAKNGRLGWPWVCTVCDARAADSSRAVALARRPCGQVLWTATAEKHRVVQTAVDAYCCSRCGRQADAAHRSGLEAAACSVPGVSRAEQTWPEGEVSLSQLLGRVAAFRRWAEPEPPSREPRPEVGQQPVGPPELPPSEGVAVRREGPAPFLAGYRGHCVGTVSRKVVCFACYQVAGAGRVESFRNSACSGVRPSGEAPPSVCDAIRRGAVVPISSGCFPRVADLARALGCRRVLLAAPVGAAQSWGRPSEEGFRCSAVGAALLAAGRAAGVSAGEPRAE